MKRKLFQVAVFVLCLIALTTLIAPVHGEAEETRSPGGFTIIRLVIAEDVEDREPVGISESFLSTRERVYCFLEAGDIEADTEITFVWYYDEAERERISLPITKGPRWRTFAYKTIEGLRGYWKVEVQDSDGAVLKTITFTVD